MSQITRCPACGTMFKVVSDQLKVSQGWVRCGHCSEVFDASMHLQPVQPVAATPLTTASQPEASGASSVQMLPEPEPEPAWSPGAYFADRKTLPQLGTPTIPDDAGVSDFDPAGWKQQLQTRPIDESGGLLLNSQGEAVLVEPQAALAGDPVSALPAVLPDAPEAADGVDDVSFLREAKRKAFWRQPAVRMVLGVFSVLLAALLGLQVLIQQRDSLSAMHPELTPGLQTLCGYLHCQIGPLRQIEAIVIDSSSFNKINADSYRLSFSLKNVASLPVAMPSLEVTLTDTQERAVLSRVLFPAELGASIRVIGAGADHAGQVLMQVLDLDAQQLPLRVAGYRVLAFYP